MGEGKEGVYPEDPPPQKIHLLTENFYIFEKNFQIHPSHPFASKSNFENGPFVPTFFGHKLKHVSLPLACLHRKAP